MAYVYIFNPFNGNFEQAIKPVSTQQVLDSVLLTTDQDTGEVGIIFDEDSILYADDEYNL